jgi:hypothetical protein
MHQIEPDASDEKVLLRNVVIAVAHKVYLNQCCAVLRDFIPAE